MLFSVRSFDMPPRSTAWLDFELPEEPTIAEVRARFPKNHSAAGEALCIVSFSCCL